MCLGIWRRRIAEQQTSTRPEEELQKLPSQVLRSVKLKVNVKFALCIVDGYYRCVVDRPFFFSFSSFLQDCGVYCTSHAYFIALSPSLSVNDNICLHFRFSVSRPGMGGIQSLPSSFCLYVVALSVHRASNMWGYQCKSRDLIQLQSAEVSRTVTSSFE